jgi:hypothetical protein
MIMNHLGSELCAGVPCELRRTLTACPDGTACDVLLLMLQCFGALIMRRWPTLVCCALCAS